MLHRELKVWQKSVKLSKKIYKITNSFPDSEKFGLISQMRRSSSSISFNIAEGNSRMSNKSFINFINIARGSLAELDTQLFLCKDLEYVDLKDINNLELDIDEIDKMLVGLIKKLG